MIAPLLERLGMPGVVGLGLLLFGLSFYLGSVAPARVELARLKQESAQLQARLPEVSGSEAGRSETAEARPSIASLPGLLKNLNSLAEQRGVLIDRASYALIERDGQRRMEINLPLKAGYLALRAYLRDVLTFREPPSLDELVLKRQQPTDAAVEANVRLSYPLSPDVSAP